VPTYQYQCTACGEGLEIVQKFTDDALTVCPKCEGQLRKVFSAVGIVFKGSGFYRNDSRAAQSSSTPPGGSASGKGESGKSESGKGDSAKSTTTAPAAASTGGSGSGSGSSNSSSSTAKPAASS
jgi:putative FmdB family regulatory protein